MGILVRQMLFYLFIVESTVFVISFSTTNISDDSIVTTVSSQSQSHTELKIQVSDLEFAVKYAKDLVDKLEVFENNLNSGQQAQQNSYSYGHTMNFLPLDEALNNTKSAFTVIKATQYLSSSICNLDRNCITNLSHIPLPNSLLSTTCTRLKDVLCSKKAVNQYRTADGSCNNKNTPSLGKSNTAYRRLLDAEYDDGIYSINLLPYHTSNVRLISTTIFNPVNRVEKNKTIAVPIWGLFIGYDLSHTPHSNQFHSNISITCCDTNGKPLPPRYTHVSCAPIKIPENDSFYDRHFQTCLDYVRTLPAMRPDCTFGPAEQMNQASHFLDGSVIYGSSVSRMNSLRSLEKGKLLTTPKTHNSKEYPPIKNSSICYISNISKCYEAGDPRVNSHPQVSVLHTMFVREHNRVAGELFKVNPQWNDEKLFQETRKIVIAEIQHITYKHWMPHVLGNYETKGKQKKHTSQPSNTVNSTSIYDENVDPTIGNSFATAALPIFYAMLENNIGLYDESRLSRGNMTLKEYFMRSKPHKKRTDYFDNVVRGLATQRSFQVDGDFPEMFTKYWYTYNGDYGIDLLSLEIQKGRDHGLPTYVHFRKLLYSQEINNFDDLKNLMYGNVIKRLKKVYDDVSKIDVFVGILSEKPLVDAMVGPTVREIMVEQLNRTKIGDRYFYENLNNGNYFTESQLNEIRKTSLARIFCDNANRVKEMQFDVFFVPDSNTNILSSCTDTDQLPAMNFRAWKSKMKNGKR